MPISARNGLFLHRKNLQSARNEVLGSTTICDRSGIRDQDSYSRSAVARRDSWRIRHARPNLNDSSILPIYGRNRASNVGAFDKSARHESACRSKSTHLTGRPDHPRPVKVGGAGCAASRRESARMCSKALPFSPGGRAFSFLAVAYGDCTRDCACRHSRDDQTRS